MQEPQTLPTPWTGYFPTQDELGIGVYSFGSRRRLDELLRVARPDVAHLHVLSGLTTSVVDALWAARVPTVMTLHNYRLVCPNALLLAHDGVCQRCVPRGRFFNAVRHRCIFDSVSWSLVFALEGYFNRVRRQYDKIDLFIAPSKFIRDIMVKAGLPAARIEVVPNAVQAVVAPTRSPRSPARFVYFGRLAREKGLDVLLAASRSLSVGIQVLIYGQGPLWDEVRRQIAEERLPVELRGHAAHDVLFNELRTATAAVLPAVSYEICSMSVLEAAGNAVATISTDLGGTPELISNGEDGILVPAGDPIALASAMNTLADQPARAVALGLRAWQRIKDWHTPEAHLSAVISCYDRAIVGRSGCA